MDLESLKQRFSLANVSEGLRDIGFAVAVVVITAVGAYYWMSGRAAERPDTTQMLADARQNQGYASMDLEYAESLPRLPRLDQVWSAVVTHVESCGLTWQAEVPATIDRELPLYDGPVNAWHARILGDDQTVVMCGWALAQQFPVVFNSLTLARKESRLRLSVLGALEE